MGEVGGGGGGGGSIRQHPVHVSPFRPFPIGIFLFRLFPIGFLFCLLPNVIAYSRFADIKKRHAMMTSFATNSNFLLSHSAFSATDYKMGRDSGRKGLRTSSLSGLLRSRSPSQLLLRTASRHDSQTTRAPILAQVAELLPKYESRTGISEWCSTVWHPPLNNPLERTVLTVLDVVESREITEQTDLRAKRL